MTLFKIVFKAGTASWDRIKQNEKEISKLVLADSMFDVIDKYPNTIAISVVEPSIEIVRREE